MTDWLLAAGAVGFAVAVITTRLAERWGRHRGLLDIPNERSSHVVPTPRIGGLGIVAGTLAATAADGALLVPQLLGLVVAGVFLAGVGLVDDLRRTSVLAKYSAQLVAAGVAAVLIQPRLDFAIVGARWSLDGAPAVVLSAIWLTAMINAFNFMDGIDGLIAGVGLVVGLIGLGLVAPSGGLLLVALAAACAGFLVWNHAPASIFMGDVGSQFVGFGLGAALLLQPERVEAVPVVLLTGVLLFDTGFTLIRRARSRRNLLAAHREHLYQRLVTAGRSHREVATGYVLATVATGLAALAWGHLPVAAQIALLAVAALAGVTYVRRVATEEVRAAG